MQNLHKAAKRFTKQTSQKGLTFIELIAGVGITSILTVMAVPSLDSLTPNSDTEASVAGIQSAADIAKLAAIDHASDVTLCHSADGKSCGGNWNDGWIVFVDRDSDRMVDGNDLIIKKGEKSEGTKIYFHSAISHSIQFNAQGFAKNPGTYQVCDNQNDIHSAHGVSINRSGLLIEAKDSNSDSVRENYDQTPFTCAS